MIPLIWTIASTAWLFVLLPAGLYLFGGAWQTRRDRIFGILSDDALELYFDQFAPGTKPTHRQDYRPNFTRYFNSLYGRRKYVVPFTFLAAISSLGIIGIAAIAIQWLSGKSLPLGLLAATSGFAGGYIWIAGDQLDRLRRRDFTPHDLAACSYRLLVAAPMGAALAVAQSAGVAVAFLLGAFPTRTLFKISRRIASLRLGLGEASEDDPTELTQLQSIGRSNAERFQDEGITTVGQLAWTDPIDLTIRTNFEFNFIIDCVSQALLWVYFGNDSRKLYVFSLRGAQEVRNLLDRKSSDDASQSRDADGTIAAAAAALQVTPEALLTTLHEVSDDPYTSFLCNIWC